MENFLSSEEIKEKLKILRNQGYDRIHIPGGTSKDGSHYAGVFIFFYNNKDKKMYFLALPYNSNFYKNGDCNGHTKKAGETPKMTARREIFEECGFIVDEGDLEFLYHYSVKDRTDCSKKHEKFFYYTDKFSGSLHTFDGPNPIDGETAAPFWIDAQTFEGLLSKNHRAIFQELKKILLNISADYYYALNY